MKDHNSELMHEAPVSIIPKPNNPNYRPEFGAREALSILALRKRVDDLLVNREQSGVLIEHMVRKTHEAKQEARIDALTGLPNRRQFNEDFTRLHERISRGGAGRLGLMLVDADGLKRLNDDERGGHPAGDKLLVNIADTLRDAMRVGDIVYRLDGDEFVALMQLHPEEEISNMTDFTTAIEARFQSIVCDGIDQLNMPEDLHIGAGVGFGVMSATESPHDFYDRVDGYLQLQKQSNREHLTSNGVNFQDPRLLTNGE